MYFFPFTQSEAIELCDECEHSIADGKWSDVYKAYAALRFKVTRKQFIFIRKPFYHET